MKRRTLLLIVCIAILAVTVLGGTEKAWADGNLNAPEVDCSQAQPEPAVKPDPAMQYENTVEATRWYLNHVKGKEQEKTVVKTIVEKPVVRTVYQTKTVIQQVPTPPSYYTNFGPLLYKYKVASKSYVDEKFRSVLLLISTQPQSSVAAPAAGVKAESEKLKGGKKMDNLSLFIIAMTVAILAIIIAGSLLQWRHQSQQQERAAETAQNIIGAIGEQIDETGDDIEIRFHAENGSSCRIRRTGRGTSNQNGRNGSSTAGNAQDRTEEPVGSSTT